MSEQLDASGQVTTDALREALAKDIGAEDCPKSATGRHAWQVDHSRPDPARPTEFDPMTDAEVYSDTGDPVYNFPYTPVPAGKVRESCPDCHLTRERDIAQVVEEERASRAAFYADDEPGYEDRWGRL